MNKEQTLETIFNTTHMALAYMDKDFNFIRVNKAYAEGAGHADSYFIGKNHFKLYPHEENETIFKNVIETGEIFTIVAKPFEFPDHPEWGVTYWDWSLYPIKSEDAKVEAVLLSLLDVTVSKKTELELLEIKKSLEEQVEIRTADLGAFSYSVSHDLRAPLRAITGFSKILLDEHKGSLNSEGLNFLNIINEACVNMNKLINDLLEHAKLRNKVVRMKPVDVTALIDSLRQIFRERMSEQQCELFTHNPLHQVHADATLLQQILMNIIENAMIFRKSDVDPKIEISSERKENWVITKITDNGIGIEPENLGLIFNPFQRLYNGKKYEGTGIGLANVKKMVELIKGEVWVESEYGVGSSFFIKLQSEN